jgi:prepilin-type N-terminal cleavage/methylation domain-containing protein/prepilin-type processing-associated H-X9-DG protein
MSEQASRNRSDRNLKDAFTLIELLAVIAIIGILAALMLTALSKAKAHAYSASCKNHLHQMGIALKMYVDEHSSTFPFYLGPAGPSYGDEIGTRANAAGLVYWSSKLFPYYSVNWTNRQFHCPGYKGTNTGPYPDTGPLYAGTIVRFGSYGYNLEGSGGNLRLDQPHLGLGPVLFWNLPPVSESQVKVPSEMLSISETRFLTDKVVKIPNGTVQSGSGGSDALGCGEIGSALFDPARHGKNYNLLLCDGHVGAMSPWDLFNPTNSAPMWNIDHQPHPDLWWPR